MLAWLALAVAAAEPAPDPMSAVVFLVQGSTVCAGTVVSADGDVVTAYHCVAPGGRPMATLEDGTRAVGRVVATDPALDLAVVEVAGLAGSPWVEVATEVPGRGAPIQVLGHPYGARLPLGYFEGTLRWSVAEGVVSAVGPRALQVSAPVNPGNSGGPVVDAQGRLVGVVSRRLGGGEGLGFATRSEHVRALLDAPRQGLGPLGGTLALGLRLSLLSIGSGTLSADALLEVALRDRVVLAGAVGVAPTARRDARSGTAAWQTAEARAGLRQRFGRGRLAPRLDGWVGVAERLVHRPSGRSSDVLLAVGGTLSAARWGVDVGVSPADGAVRTSLVWRWPGVLRVY